MSLFVLLLNIQVLRFDAVSCKSHLLKSQGRLDDRASSFTTPTDLCIPTYDDLSLSVVLMASECLGKWHSDGEATGKTYHDYAKNQN